MLKIVICDNENVTVDKFFEKTNEILSKITSDFAIDIYTESEKLLSDLYDGKKWDVYFLDIDMPIVGGFELGEKIRSIDSTCYLVYVSIHREKVYQSFKTKPFRFIPKDEYNLHIASCIQDIITDMKKENQTKSIVLEVGTVLYSFPSDQIMYIQSCDKYIKFYFANGSSSEFIRYKIGDLEVEISELGFIRTHKRYLVNYTFIQKILADEIVLDNGSTLPISRARIDEIKSIYRRLML